MKTIIFLLFTFFAIQNFSYAAFPIVENCNSITVATDLSVSATVATDLPVSAVDGVATISMILAGIAVFFNLILLTSSGLGWGALFLLVLSGVFYIAAFLLGLIGLWSKNKKWQALIGVFSGLLVLLVLAISAGSTGDPNAKD